MERKLEKLEEKLKELEDKMKQSGKGKVAFSVAAEQGGAVGPLSANTTLRFNTEMSNVDNVFNLNTGIFTAPVDGLYYFTFFYRTPANKESMLILYKNGREVLKSSETERYYGGTDTAGNAAILKLKADDELYLTLPAGNSIWAAGRQTTFSGFLLDFCHCHHG
ncbi:complement C1q tumor necrosis factor-related protein 3-like [Scophthalmus maximus]|nr:complement C1q tumor necrosis factor-related protein 3-like isoform X2 [Scophthalmus maximus]XP_047192082.1 complement C1q tumor necrosis factor-related protein 3-like [Scophthalmus maximus]XP_047192083.1 complement C1q tumor necrosis factor-related protein 3-like [Scophthalmus maximus]